ncbi:MAG: hypothetical protein RL329_2326 [Bacteroidota bacterium]|jgi:16S rRNA (adenine1518-N6/adenine1519-N6)-dimethyltransferase
MKAKKSFGQHFLHRQDIAQRIVNGLLLTEKYPRILEIGPGKGVLTQYLLEKKAQGIELLAVDADRDMVDYLHEHFPVLKGSVLEADFLKLDLTTLFNQEFCLLGNFPYNISSQILFKMIDFKTVVPEMVGMFQKEVAERVCAPPGSKTYGILSVLCQAFYETKYLFTVDKSAFNPPPQVQSGVIRLTRKANLDLGCDEKLFKQVVKAAFGQRRKMLRNSLLPIFGETPIPETAFFTKRPEQLSLETFIELTQLISKLRLEGLN